MALVFTVQCSRLVSSVVKLEFCIEGEGVKRGKEK